MHLYVMTLKESNRYGLDLMSVFFVEILTDGLRKVNTVCIFFCRLFLCYLTFIVETAVCI